MELLDNVKCVQLLNVLRYIFNFIKHCVEMAELAMKSQLRQFLHFIYVMILYMQLIG